MRPAIDLQNAGRAGNDFTVPVYRNPASVIHTGGRELNLDGINFQGTTLPPQMERSHSHQTQSSYQPTPTQPVHQWQQTGSHATLPAAEQPPTNPPLSGDNGTSGSSSSINPHSAVHTYNQDTPHVMSGNPSRLGPSSEQHAHPPLSETEIASQIHSPPNDNPWISWSPHAMRRQPSSQFPAPTGNPYPQQTPGPAHSGRQDATMPQLQQQYQTLPQLPPLHQYIAQQSALRLAASKESEPTIGERTPLILHTSSASQFLPRPELALPPTGLGLKRRNHTGE